MAFSGSKKRADWAKYVALSKVWVRASGVWTNSSKAGTLTWTDNADGGGGDCWRADVTLHNVARPRMNTEAVQDLVMMDWLIVS